MSAVLNGCSASVIILSKRSSDLKIVFISDVVRTIIQKFRIGNFWIKDSGQGLTVRDAEDNANARLTCSELSISGDVAEGDRSVRIQRSPSTTSSYTLTLPVNAGSVGDFLKVDSPGILSFAAPSGGSDVIPVNRGGTGLSTLGLPGQSIRVNSDGTGFEFYTPNGNSEEGEEDMFNEVLYLDSNWGLYDQSAQRYAWRSYIPQYIGNPSSGEQATGAIEFGYAVLRGKLILILSGGGNTNGSLKRIKLIRATDGVSLIDTTLNALMPIDTSGLLPVVINTSAYSGTRIKLRLEDNDTGSGWAWMGFYPPSSYTVP